MQQELHERVEALEAQVQALRESVRYEIKRAAHELRDDSDFSGPYWRSGADHAVDHLFTKASRKLLMYIAGAVAAAVLLWLGSLGIFK